jgi:O-antigen ligase
MPLIKPSTSEKIYYFLLPAIAFVLPLHDKLVPPVIALVGLNWLMEMNFSEKLSRIRNSVKNKFILAFSSLFILYIIGTFYSTQLTGQSGALFDLEVKLSLLFFPLLFSTINFESFNAKFSEKIFQAYITGCIISALLLVNAAIYRYFHSFDIREFYYSNLSMMHHPSYIAMYFGFAIIILIHKLIMDNNLNAFKRTVIIMVIILFQGMIVLLSSKASIIGLALAYLLALLLVIFSKFQKKINPAILITLLLASFIVMNLLSPQTYSRFIEAGKVLETQGNSTKQADNSSEIRILIWKSALEIIRLHPVFGVGTGDVKAALQTKYEEKNITMAHADHLNSHNQYLQTALAIGITGFIVLVGSLFLPVIYTFRKRNFLYTIFILLFSFNLLVESMLERQAGVVFYAFFNALLFSNLLAHPKPSDPELPQV